MNKTTKNILLIVILVIIVGSIIFIESKKPKIAGLAPGEVQSIALTPGTTSTLDVATTSNFTNSSTDSTGSPQSTSGSSVKTTDAQNQIRLAAEAKEYPSAVELIPGGGFINSDPFTLKSLIGKKVILVDFWTYSCINCLRTIPYLNAWYQKYKDDGLVIVGVHTPEFDFEKDYDNVASAVKRLGIQYPVVQDNDYATWNAYQNRFWPHEYLINIDGYIVHDKIGEGDYDGTEKAIQQALVQRGEVLGINQNIDMSISNPATAVTLDATEVQSPETYFGSNRNEYLANGTQGQPGSQTLSVPASPELNMLYLDGTWNFAPEYAENTSSAAKIVFQYNAKNVYLVGSSLNGVKVKVLLDGQPVGQFAGADVGADGTVTIKDNRLYSLVQGVSYGVHTIELDIESSGLDAYTFTFG